MNQEEIDHLANNPRPQSGCWCSKRNYDAKAGVALALVLLQKFTRPHGDGTHHWWDEFGGDLRACEAKLMEVLDNTL